MTRINDDINYHTTSSDDCKNKKNQLAIYSFCFNKRKLDN